MSSFEGLPDTRTSLRGLTDEGHEAWLIRSIAGKLYRCPGCHGFYGASSMERLPTEIALTDQTRGIEAIERKVA